MAETTEMTTTEPSTPAAGRLAEVVLFAEFDIDKGSTLRESYPREVPNYSPEFFADVMLPEGVHNRKEDFTIFFLNRSSAKTKPAAVVGEEGEGDGAKDGSEPQDPMREFMYCVSVVRTIYDSSARRGATVKAVALCSRQKVLKAQSRPLRFVFPADRRRYSTFVCYSTAFRSRMFWMLP